MAYIQVISAGILSLTTAELKARRGLLNWKIYEEKPEKSGRASKQCIIWFWDFIAEKQATMWLETCSIATQVIKICLLDMMERSLRAIFLLMRRL